MVETQHLGFKSPRIPGEVPFAYQVLSATLGRAVGLVNSVQEEQLNGRVVEGRQRTGGLGLLGHDACLIGQ